MMDTTSIMNQSIDYTDCRANQLQSQIYNTSDKIKTIEEKLNSASEKIDNITSALAAIGVSCYDANGNFKSMLQICKEIGDAMFDSDALPEELKKMMNTNHMSADMSNCCCETATTSNNIYNQITQSTSCDNYTTTTIPVMPYNTGGYVDWNNTIWTNDPWRININGSSYTYTLNPEPVEENKKEKKNNMNNLFGFEFGAIDDGSIAMSAKGMAVKNKDNKYVAYDSEKNEVVDVTVFTLHTATKMFYKIPVALKDVAIGDVIIHNSDICFVVDGDDNTLDVVNISRGTFETIFPAKSPFGFNFITKVVSLFNFDTANKDNPFGNVLPFLLMGDGDKKDMLPLIMMCGQGNFDMNNPMMMYFLMKDGKADDLLPFFLMQNNK